MPSLSVTEIRELLPHRYPMLMIDRVLDYSDDRLVAIKAVTSNEPVFQGHFPHWPIFPGVLILEAMVQASAVMASLALGAKADDNRVYLFAGIDKARFKQPVVPGDCIQIETRSVRRIRDIWKTAAEAKVGDVVVCSAELLFTFQEL
jgi:3-hydroxyacyl-[acyl-carrier-protein] dehydratase